VKAALILAVGLIAAGIFNGGIYQIVVTRQGDVLPTAYRLNRLTGDVTANRPLALRYRSASITLGFAVS
jgi:hypothetical protein